MLAANPFTSRTGLSSLPSPFAIGASSSTAKASPFGSSSASTNGSGFGQASNAFGRTSNGFGQGANGGANAGFGSHRGQNNGVGNQVQNNGFGQRAQNSGFGSQGQDSGFSGVPNVGTSMQNQSNFSSGFGQNTGFGGSAQSSTTNFAQSNHNPSPFASGFVNTATPLTSTPSPFGGASSSSVPIMSFKSDTSIGSGAASQVPSAGFGNAAQQMCAPRFRSAQAEAGGNTAFGSGQTNVSGGNPFGGGGITFGQDASTSGFGGGGVKFGQGAAPSGFGGGSLKFGQGATTIGFGGGGGSTRRFGYGAASGAQKLEEPEPVAEEKVVDTDELPLEVRAAFERDAFEPFSIPEIPPPAVYCS